MNEISLAAKSPSGSSSVKNNKNVDNDFMEKLKTWLAKGELNNYSLQGGSCRRVQFDSLHNSGAMTLD